MKCAFRSSPPQAASMYGLCWWRCPGIRLQSRSLLKVWGTSIQFLDKGLNDPDWIVLADVIV